MNLLQSDFFKPSWLHILPIILIGYKEVRFQQHWYDKQAHYLVINCLNNLLECCHIAQCQESFQNAVVLNRVYLSRRAKIADTQNSLNTSLSQYSTYGHRWSPQKNKKNPKN